jgi:hypothetical protein
MVGATVPREFWRALFSADLRGTLLTDLDALTGRLLDVEGIGADYAVGGFALVNADDPVCPRIEVSFWLDLGRVSHAWLRLHFRSGCAPYSEVVF